jgi:nucleoside-diphosphate-sugar epimerase
VTRILVTGAAGFIGSHLCEELLRRGHHVRGLDSFTTFYDPRRKLANLVRCSANQRFELVTGDLLDNVLCEALEGVDAVAHLAGEPGVTSSWGSSFDRYVRRNVLATQRLLEAVSVGGVQRLVYASSSSVYGTGCHALRAQGEPRPASPYGVSKLAAETLVGAYAETRGVPAVSLRYFSVYGPRQRPDMAAHRFIDALVHDRPLTLFGDGGQVRDFTYVDDVVDATVRALFADLPPAAVFDIASGRPVSVATLIKHLEQLVGAPSAGLHRSEERPGDVPRTEGVLDATREHLGWSPTTGLRTGLRRQVQWHLQELADADADAVGQWARESAALLPPAAGA